MLESLLATRCIDTLQVTQLGSWYFTNVRALTKATLAQMIESTMRSGAQVCAVSSLHAPVVWHAWLSQFFGHEVVFTWWNKVLWSNSVLLFLQASSRETVCSGGEDQLQVMSVASMARESGGRYSEVVSRLLYSSWRPFWRPLSLVITLSLSPLHICSFTRSLPLCGTNICTTSKATNNSASNYKQERWFLKETVLFR